MHLLDMVEERLLVECLVFFFWRRTEESLWELHLLSIRLFACEHYAVAVSFDSGRLERESLEQMRVQTH